MRSGVLLVATVLAGTSSVARADPPAPRETGTRFVTIDADAVATAQAVAAADGDPAVLLASEDGLAVLAIDAEDLEALTHAMHEDHGRCGGYMLHESEADAMFALRDAAPRPAPDYTLDRAAAVSAVLPALDAARIQATIGELAAMKNRHYQSATGAAAAIWLRDRWQSFTTRPEVTVRLVDHGYRQPSVILTIPGSTRADEVVVLGAHLDSIALGGAGSTAPGADDDASGIATLTEVARALLANHFRPARTIELIAYAAEEVGLRGSQAIVRDHVARKVDVVGALQLDMTNYQGSDKDIWLMKDFTSTAQNGFLIRLIDTYVGATWGLDACGYACSDHASWYRAGVPASMPFEARTRDRNRAIHTGRDTLEISGNNAHHAVKFARLAAAYAIELGKGELGPPPSSSRAASARACHGRSACRSGSAGALVASAALGLLALGLLGRGLARRAR